jgi:hypothetical protein
MDLCAGIHAIPLADISIYPMPADRSIYIDMRQNNDLISSNYSAIIIYNSFGQRMHSISRQGSSKLVELSVADMSDGIYLATIADAKGAERVLGKFVVGH